MSDLKAALQRLTKTNTGFDALIELATVKSVDELKLTCTVALFDNEDLILEGVKLKPVVPGLDLTEMGAITFPVVGSKVLIGQINSNEKDLFVVMFSKVKKVSLDAGSLFKMAMDMQGGSMALGLAKLAFNGGKNGGMPKVKPLLEKINQLEKTLNALTEAFNTHTHAGVANGLGTTGLSLKKGDKIKDITLLSDIENKAITQ